MKLKKQRIAIAEIQGWRFQKQLHFKSSKDFPKGYQGSGVYRPDGSIACFYDARGNDYQNLDWETCFQRGFIPDYPNDLNAIHSLIMSVIVRGKDIVKFRSNEDLFQIELDKISEREQVPVWHFTAGLYSEALLKTLNLWGNK